MDFANFAFYGFIILFIGVLYSFINNPKENNYIIFGSLLLFLGFLYAIIETFNYIHKKSVSNISKSHLILGAFLLLSFIFPINKFTKKTDIFGLIGHFILINTSFGYSEIANICLTIHYSLFTYRNGTNKEIINKFQSIGGGLILLYYIKKTIDKWYIKKEYELKEIKHL
jgi:hypothetical protein